MAPAFCHHSVLRCHASFFFFFFNDTATTEIYTLSLHDALPIYSISGSFSCRKAAPPSSAALALTPTRSDEHTSELQSHSDLVCRLLLEKKKKNFPAVPDSSRETHELSMNPRSQIASVAPAARIS